MSRRILFAWVPALLLLALSGFFAWLLHTESGATWAWARAVSASSGVLQAEAVRGDVRSGMILQGVRFRADAVDIEAPMVECRLDFDLFPPAVSVEQLDADRIVVRTRPNAQPGADQLLAETFPESLALPLPIDFTQVRIGEIHVLDANQQLQFSASELTFSARLHKSLEISRAGAGAAGANWQLSGTISLDAPFAVDLSVTTKADSANQILPALEARATFKGNLDQLDVDAHLAEPAVKLQGRISHLAGKPSLDVGLSAAALQWPLGAAPPDFRLHEADVRVTGGLKDYQLRAAGRLNVTDLPEVALNLEGRGDLGGFEVKNLGAAGEPVEFTATGAVGWGETFRVALDATIARLAPDHWMAEWPREQSLHGRLSFEWAGERVHFTAIDLAAGTSGFTISGSGELDPQRDVVDADLAWTGFHWPLGSEAPEFRSGQGEVSVTGSPSDWSATGALHLQAAEWPDGQVRLSGDGDLESAEIRIEQGEALGGAFEGHLHYRWKGAQPWSTELRIRNLDLSAFGNGLPQAIGGELSAEGQLEPLAFNVNLNNIHGSLRGQPLAANGGVTYQGNDLQARDLDIRSGESGLSLDGNPEHPGGLRFSAHVANFGEFLADAGGSFDGQGLLSVHETQPRLELEARGSGLVFGEWQIGAFKISGSGQAAGEPGLQLDIADLAIGKRKAQEISLTTAGRNLFDRIHLSARQDERRWDIELSGDASRWPLLVASAWQNQDAAKNAGSWQGQIDSWRIEEEPLGWLQLEEPAPLSFGGAALDVGPACFRGPRDGRICFDARLGDEGATQANARLDRISLSLLSLLTHSKMEFSQTLTGHLHWDKAREELAEAEVSIDISPGEISFPEGEEPIKTGAGRFAFRISDGQLLEGDLDLELPESGNIDTNFSVPDMSRGADSPVEGSIRVALRDIAPLLTWVHQLDQVGGSLDANVMLAGSVAEPRFTGHAALVHGYLENRATGTVLRDIQLAGAVFEFDHTEMNGSFQAGQGRGQLKANLRFDDFFNPEITLALAGQNLTLLNVPDLVVVADPDLEFYWHDGLLKLNGDVLIPRARLSPRYLPTATVSESADLRIVAGTLPPEEKSAFDRSRLRLNGTVGVALGDDVSVTLDRATANLTGKTVFTWDDSLVPIADGQYRVHGKITAYGQLLEITDGRVGFPNIPADNPHLDIRAEREIYGNVQVRKAGVLLSGTLRRPILEAYTTPQTTAERALTLLVTGHDFDSEQGVGGVEVGMYVAPKLYVSYGIGLFENQNVISARYEIKGGFGIKATSGQRETGADVIYTIEH